MGGLAKQFLLNRVTVTFAIIIVLIIGWNLYVAANNDGTLTGRAVDAQGQPVGGATIMMTARNVDHDVEAGSTLSGDDGSFRFHNHGQYNLILTAEKDNIGKSEPVHVRLYFRNENFALRAPLVLARQR